MKSFLRISHPSSNCATFVAWLILLLPCICMGEETKTAATIYNRRSEEVLVGPGSLVCDKGRLVPDAAARTGWALLGDPTDKPGKGLLWFGYTYGQGPGKVKVAYRLKVADNTSPEPVAVVQVCIWDTELVPNTNNPETPIRGTDFRQPNQYQEFSFEIDKGEAGFGGWGVQTTGKTKLSYDGIEVEQLSQFSTAELMARVQKPVRPANLTLAADSRRLHETHGLFMEKWGVKEAWPKGEWTESYFKFHPQYAKLTGFFVKWEDLYKQQVVVLNNVPAKAVTIVGCMMLKQYVEDGGTLVMMGDTHGLAAGQWNDNVLTPLLPVTLEPGEDRVSPSEPLHIKPAVRSLAQGIDWRTVPCTLYYHKATVRPGARILLKSGDIPLAVDARVGKGRIIVLLMSVLGEKKPGTTGIPFWEWNQWPSLMARLLDASKDAPELKPAP